VHHLLADLIRVMDDCQTVPGQRLACEHIDDGERKRRHLDNLRPHRITVKVPSG
jgi:hypothetical protein